MFTLVSNKSTSCVKCNGKIRQSAKNLVCLFCKRVTHKTCSGIPVQDINTLVTPTSNFIFVCSSRRPNIRENIKRGKFGEHEPNSKLITGNISDFQSTSSTHAITNQDFHEPNSQDTTYSTQKLIYNDHLELINKLSAHIESLSLQMNRLSLKMEEHLSSNSHTSTNFNQACNLPKSNTANRYESKIPTSSVSNTKFKFRFNRRKSQESTPSHHDGE